MILRSIFLFFTIAYPLFANERPAVSKELEGYATDWNIDNTIIHMNNHINNNLRLSNLIVDEYAEKGIPERVDHKGQKIPAITAEQVRASLGIPEEYWQDESKRKTLKEFVKGFLIIHDAAKVDTSQAYLAEQDQKLAKEKRFLDKKGDLKQIYIIQGLDRAFGSNPWKIPKDASAEEVKKLKEVQYVIKLLNEVDTNTGNKLLNARAIVSKDLKYPWVRELAEKVEKLVDNTERWGNEVSVLEFNRQMTRGSEETPLGYGKFRKKTAEEYVKPANVIQIALESDYSSHTEKYADYHKRVERFFGLLKSVGLDVDQMDPIRKYELIPMLMEQERNLKSYEKVNLQTKIFSKYKNQIAQLFKDPVPGEVDPKQKFLEDAKKFHQNYSDLYLSPRVALAKDFKLSAVEMDVLSRSFSTFDLMDEAQKAGGNMVQNLEQSIQSHGNENQKKHMLMFRVRQALINPTEAAVCK